MKKRVSVIILILALIINLAVNVPIIINGDVPHYYWYIMLPVEIVTIICIVGILQTKEQSIKVLTERFEFRNIRDNEIDQAVTIEHICFPPNEACSRKAMTERIKKAPELFLVAVDKETGKIAGFLNGLSTNEDAFRDEFFTDVNLYNPEGKNIMLLGLDVLPEYRGQGLAREIVNQYLRREQENNREIVFLTCLDLKVKMYEKMGFVDNGIANSSWGGEEWHQMSVRIN